MTIQSDGDGQGRRLCRRGVPAFKPREGKRSTGRTRTSGVVTNLEREPVDRKGWREGAVMSRARSTEAGRDRGLNGGPVTGVEDEKGDFE